MPADFDIKKPGHSGPPSGPFRALQTLPDRPVAAPSQQPPPSRGQPTAVPKRQLQTTPSSKGGIMPKTPKKRAGSGGARPKAGYNYWRIVSQLAFSLALLAILGIIAHLTIIPDAEKVNSYAMYAFFLLIAATVSLAFESRDRK
jgi:hypothetical protein